MSAGSRLNPACLNSSLASTVRCPSADRPSAMLNENIAASRAPLRARQAWRRSAGRRPARHEARDEPAAIGERAYDRLKRLRSRLQLTVGAISTGSVLGKRVLE